MRKFVAGVVVGIGLCIGVAALRGQDERALHPRLSRAIEALRDARAYLESAPHDFGGHKRSAIRATDDAITQLNLALRYRAREDRR